ncbi:MAG: hypothetical protein HZA91_07280 [Verrucomicrobia bacterium]|nr:hypothetical protein [Verrucomicrobiota bacterium]
MKTNIPHHRRLGRRDFIGCVAGGAWLACGFPRATAGAAKPSATQSQLYWAWWGWEPLDHYRRTGGIVGAVDTKSPSMPQWYERLHSEEVVRMMAGLGVNLACTHFFKGFGLVHERAERQRTAGLVKFAHKHGIKVLGYCQSRSIYHEQFLAEVPNAEDWIQHDEKGQLRTWGGAKFRWAPCIHCGEFRDYMKRAIRVGLEEVGLDGFHFDNNYCQPCYCKRCEAAFRAWMAQRRPECRDVKQPPTEKTPDRITDPVVQEWVRWRCESLAEYQADLKAHAQRIKPDVILLGNPAYPRDPNSAYARSVWAPLLGRQLDLMFAENGNFPGIEDGALISQVRACKHAAAVGYRVVSTVWKKNKLTGLGLPDDEAAIALQIAESAANGALPGTNWALRPLGEGDRMRVERPDLRAALAKHLRFARVTESLRASAKPVRDIAVLHTFASTVFDNREAVALAQGAEEVLIRGGFVWDVVFGEDIARLSDFAVLVLAGQSHLSDAEADAIRAFRGRGGALILVGGNPAFDALRGERIVRVEAEAVRAATKTSEGRVVLPKDWKRLADAIARASGDRFAARLRGSDAVTLSAYEFDGRRLVAHLVNYANDPTSALNLELGKRWQTCRKARLLTPDGPERKLVVRQGPQPSVELPSFKIYGVVIVE